MLCITIQFVTLSYGSYDKVSICTYIHIKTTNYTCNDFVIQMSRNPSNYPIYIKNMYNERTLVN